MHTECLKLIYLFATESAKKFKGVQWNYVRRVHTNIRFANLTVARLVSR